MRLNVKKALIFVGCVVFLWVLLSYASVIEVPRAVPQKDPAVEIEKKIIKLQKQVDAQMAESKSLLAKVKKLKKISEGENVGGEEDSLKDSEVMQRKYLFVF